MPYEIRQRDGRYCVMKTPEGTAVPGGCHPTKAEAMDHMRALYANVPDAKQSATPSVFVNDTGVSVTWTATTGANGTVAIGNGFSTGTSAIAIGGPGIVTPPPAADPPAGGVPWSGPVAFENQTTGDGRVFDPGAITWDPDSLPQPFRWVRADSGGHQQAVVIGRVDAYYRDHSVPDTVFARGVVLDGETAPPEAAEFLALAANGAAGGVSVDGDDAEFTIVETADGALNQRFSQMRLRGLTAVDIPAFIGAHIALTDAVAASCGCADDDHFTELASTTPWDGSTGRFTDQQYQRAAAGCDPGDAPPKTRCFLPHHDPGGALNINGLHAAAQRASALKGHSPAAVAAAKAHLRGHYASVKEDPPDSIKAAVRPGWWDEPLPLVAAAIPVEPPTDWFTDPALDGPTPVTVTADGRIYGHLALFGTCHIGMPRGCVTPPRGGTYAYFHTGEVLTAGGEPVAVGHLTFGTGHADMGANALAAASHYDDTGTVAADVRAGEDAHGIWVAGALRPHLSDEQVREFRAAPLSGDWRRIGGRLELVAALAVNTPGFPVPRTRARVLVASGHEQAVIAATPPEEFEPDDEARAQTKQRLANTVRLRELVHRVGGR